MKKIKNFNRRLAVTMLRTTAAFRVGNISYSATEGGLRIWSINSFSSGNFNATEIIPLFIHPFSSYLEYNEKENRVELIIF